MKKLWIFGGVVAIAVSAGAVAINIAANSAPARIAAAEHTNVTASNPRQRMARVIAETAARSAAQTAKTLVAGGVEADRGNSDALMQASTAVSNSR